MTVIQVVDWLHIYVHVTGVIRLFWHLEYCSHLRLGWHMSKFCQHKVSYANGDPSHSMPTTFWPKLVQIKRFLRLALKSLWFLHSWVLLYLATCSVRVTSRDSASANIPLSSGTPYLRFYCWWITEMVSLVFRHSGYLAEIKSSCALSEASFPLPAGTMLPPEGPLKRCAYFSSAIICALNVTRTCLHPANNYF